MPKPQLNQNPDGAWLRMYGRRRPEMMARQERASAPGKPGRFGFVLGRFNAANDRRSCRSRQKAHPNRNLRRGLVPKASQS